jgi:Vacuolar protein sorting-associated protein 62
MPEHDDLLKRFQPVLRYDSNEQFFADSAEQFMINPGNELRRKRTDAGNGAVLASAEPKAGQAQLTLDFLGRTAYADGSAVQDGDILSVRGDDYREQYRALRIAHPELTNVVYAHAVEANGRIWLQYWFWYFYNDYQLSFALGTHEGDWEMVQLRMDGAADQPDLAVYAQHRYGEERTWDKVETLAGRPVVYSARGSHASYFEAGFHQTEAWYDLADGKRRMKDRPRLEILGDDDPAWPLWTGRWGDTLPRTGLESNSPTGPGAKKQWTRPDSMLDSPPPTSSHDAKAPKAPDVTILRASGRLRVEYDVSKRDPRPTTLVVTVNSEDEPGIPPRTLNLAVDASGHDKVTTDVVLDPVKHYDVYASIVVGNPPKPSESAETRIEPFAPPKPTFVQQVLGAVSSTIATIRGDRR